MKRITTLLFALLPLIATCTVSVFASSEQSWQKTYFNKLAEIRERPGVLRLAITDKDKNGFATDTICYALTDYNRDRVPELIVYGTNIAGEAGDNYKIFTSKDGKLNEFKFVCEKGPDGDVASFSKQPYWPYYCNFFYMPDGYTDLSTGDLVWAMATDPDDYEFWTVAGAPYIDTTVFEVSFNFTDYTANIHASVYPELGDGYGEALKAWTESHELTVAHSEYGRRIPENNEMLWKQLQNTDYCLERLEPIPKLSFGNKLLTLRNRLFHSTVAWYIGAAALFLLISAMITLFVRHCVLHKKQAK